MSHVLERHSWILRGGLGARRPCGAGAVVEAYPRDRRIVDMSNLSVCEIAEALGTTDSDVRESLTRIASEVGPTGEVG